VDCYVQTAATCHIQMDNITISAPTVQELLFKVNLCIYNTQCHKGTNT